MTTGKYPGWRTMSSSERYNARMHRIFDDARAREIAAKAEQVKDRLHPQSLETLRQLVKLHGAPAVLDAVQSIVDADAYARLDKQNGSK